MAKPIKIIIENHPDGYVAYPIGLKGVVVGEGDTSEEALADVKSAIAFHLETFAGDLGNLSTETLLREIEWEEKWDQTLEENPEALKRLLDRAKKQYREGKTKEMGFGELLEDMHDLAVIAERRDEGSISLETSRRACGTMGCCKTLIQNKPMKACHFCGNKNFKYTSTQYTYRRNDKFLIVNHVPCEECEYCGEQYFQAPVLKKIENEFNAIHFRGKKAKTEVPVPVEHFGELRPEKP